MPSQICLGNAPWKPICVLMLQIRTAGQEAPGLTTLAPWRRAGLKGSALSIYAESKRPL